MMRYLFSDDTMGIDTARRCGAEGRECGSCHDQDQAHHSIRGLVPHWLQVRHQLSATYCAGVYLFSTVFFLFVHW